MQDIPIGVVVGGIASEGYLHILAEDADDAAESLPLCRSH